MSLLPLRAAVLAALVTQAPLASLASGQVTLTGPVSDGAGGPLLAGSVYHSTGFLVPVGTTLSAASTLSHATVRYAELAGWSAITISEANTDIPLSNCTFSQSLTHGVDLNGQPAKPTVTGCAFVDNSQLAVADCPIDSVPGFTFNTAAGNGGNFIRVTLGSLQGNLSLNESNCLGGALVIASPVIPGSGETLTLGPGTVLKLESGQQVSVSGALKANGTAQKPVVITSIKDDSVGGDTNNDGLSSGAPGDWGGITLVAGPSGTSSLEHVLLRYPGAFNLSGLSCQAVGSHLRAVRVDGALGTGLVGGTANSSADPLFRDAPNGDLRLLSGSPCIDTGDASDLPSGLDGAGFPRLMDGNLDGVPVVDRGAFEWSQLEIALGGNFTPGGQAVLTVTRHAAFAQTWLFVGLGYSEQLLPKAGGGLWVDLNAPHVIWDDPGSPAPVIINVSPGLPVPQEFVLQVGAQVTNSPASAVNLSNPLRVTVE